MLGASQTKVLSIVECDVWMRKLVGLPGGVLGGGPQHLGVAQAQAGQRRDGCAQGLVRREAGQVGAEHRLGAECDHGLDVALG